jgi:hypothetical protein
MSASCSLTGAERTLAKPALTEPALTKSAEKSTCRLKDSEGAVRQASSERAVLVPNEARHIFGRSGSRKPISDPRELRGRTENRAALLICYMALCRPLASIRVRGFFQKKSGIFRAGFFGGLALSGVKQTSQRRAAMSAHDPKRTLLFAV